MRPDWYQSTVAEYPRVLADALMSEMPGAHELVSGRGRLNYKESMSVVDVDGDTLATVLHGGLNGAPNAVATGENAEPFMHVIRRHWPEHCVTRYDSCEDVLTSFPDALTALRTIADELRIKGETRLPDDPEDGATYYMGSPSSRVRVRCYEKGKQLRAQGVQEADPALVRFEVQLRPSDRQARLVAARLEPGDVWGATAWSQRVAGVFDHSPDRVVMRHRLKTTYERRHAALLVQYGGHLREMLARHGSWELVGEQLGLDLA